MFKSVVRASALTRNFELFISWYLGFFRNKFSFCSVGHFLKCFFIAIAKIIKTLGNEKTIKILLLPVPYHI